MLPQPPALDLDAYAGSVEHSPYDELARHNREYRRLLDEIGRIFSAHPKPCLDVADLGCGTGNATLAIAGALSGRVARITAVDSHPGMLRIARRKFLGLPEVKVMRGDIGSPDLFPSASLDAVNITHVLNVSQRPVVVLLNIRKWLRPGGLLVVADIGREIRVGVWGAALLKWAYQDHRVRGLSRIASTIDTARWAWGARAAARQNRRYQVRSRAGHIWTHTSAEFRRVVEDAGFSVESLSTEFYRDPASGLALDDLCVARSGRAYGC